MLEKLLNNWEENRQNSNIFYYFSFGKIKYYIIYISITDYVNENNYRNDEVTVSNRTRLKKNNNWKNYLHIDLK